MTDRERFALVQLTRDMRREAALWPKTDRAQQTARLLIGYADRIDAVLAHDDEVELSDARPPP